MKTRTFHVVQYEINPKTGEDLHFNETNIITALSHKSIKEWAYICHDKDTYSEDDEANGIGTAGKTKGTHWHIVGRSDRAIDIVVLANWFGVPANCIDVPK